MVSTREVTSKAIWKIWNNFYTKLLEGKGFACQTTDSTIESTELCQRSLLGSIHQQFHREGISPLWLQLGSTTDITRSLHEHGAALRRINLQTVGQSHSDIDHSICNPTPKLLEATQRWLLPDAAWEYFRDPKMPGLEKALSQQERKWHLK